MEKRCSGRKFSETVAYSNVENRKTNEPLDQAKEISRQHQK